MENRQSNNRCVNLCVFEPKWFVGILLCIFSAIFCIIGQGSYKACVFFVVLMLIVASVRFDCCNKESTKKLNVLWNSGAVFVFLFATQLLMNNTISSLGWLQIILGMACSGIVLLFFFICTFDSRLTVILSAVLLMALVIANYFVFNFRGNELSPEDFWALGTAMNVAGQYNYTIDAPFAYACILVILYCFVGFCIPNYKEKRNLKRTATCIALEVILVLTLFFGTKNIQAKHFFNEGTVYNGFLLNFVCRMESAMIEKPENYNQEEVRKIEDDYLSMLFNQDSDELPHVIVIMNESFADFRVLGELNTNIDIMPFYDSMNENVIKGYALSSVFGGGTCNSEYEVLTGNTMVFLPQSSYPYQQFIKDDIYTMASYLNEKGYKCIGTHPNLAVNWMRNSIYPKLGFEETYYIDHYPQTNLLRTHVSDQEMYDQIIKWYEENQNEKMFLFGVTMQNHSGYEYVGEDYSDEIELEGYSMEYPQTEQYLSLIHESDNALKNLVNYFGKIEEKVVLVFYGDHMPRVEEEFYTEIQENSTDDLEYQIKKYMVPFVIWTNYEIEEQYVECTSLNYLSNYVYEAAGIELPAYNTFLMDVRAIIPAMNSLGYYSKEQSKFVPYVDAFGIEAEILKRYEILQYNSLFDIENRSDVFFGIEE